jgi:IS30 family transposase
MPTYRAVCESGVYTIVTLPGSKASSHQNRDGLKKKKRKEKKRKRKRKEKKEKMERIEGDYK